MLTIIHRQHTNMVRRPSNSRIAHFIRENNRLRDSLNNLQEIHGVRDSSNSVQRSRSPSDPLTPSEIADELPAQTQTSNFSNSRAQAACGASDERFHGPSSALHNPASDEFMHSTNLPPFDPADMLFAEAARQRGCIQITCHVHTSLTL